MAKKPIVDLIGPQLRVLRAGLVGEVAVLRDGVLAFQHLDDDRGRALRSRSLFPADGGEGHATSGLCTSDASGACVRLLTSPC